MNKRQIVNIVNFIRDVEPRGPVDLVEPVREQIAVMKKYGLRGTFLLQYDALIDPVYVGMLKELDPAQFELGVWFEVVEPQCRDAGIEWTGRFPWDWHVHCGFSMGYTKPQREKLCDVLFEKFRETFGYYPRVFGSWFFDTHTVRYLSDKYGLDALCNCKEQYGTDGYTLWGGYYGQAYYPSRKNVFMPAQTGEGQIPVPLFRMLGSDPVYQYDFGMSAEAGASRVQGVITLEPVYNGGGGGIPAWVDWFLRENYNGDCLTFGYAQAGQENSFGWPGMKNGIEYQFAEFARLVGEGKITVEPLGDTGRWFKENWGETPASAITAHTAWDDPGKNSVWYCTKNYRINLYAADGDFRIRDLHIFDERTPDPFEDTVCPANEAVYETLPVIDGNRHTGRGVVAGAVLTREGKPVRAGEMTFEDLGGGEAKIGYGAFSILLREDGFRVESDGDFRLEYRIGRYDDHMPAVVSCKRDALVLRYMETEYGLALKSGSFDGPTAVRSENGAAEFAIIRK
ncbi:MAG: hypothetical protein II650_04550 [Clostridia bacterium]|nr:hypothetical protein [Clostridia bacterium]MBQ4193507.1 hypothetical protein [Clostridia bacterium]